MPHGSAISQPLSGPTLISRYIEQPVECGNCQYSADIRATVGDPYPAGLLPGVLAQQKQHAERRAVHIIGTFQIDNIATLIFRDIPIGGPKVTIQPEVEATDNGDRPGTSIR